MSKRLKIVLGGVVLIAAAVAGFLAWYSGRSDPELPRGLPIASTVATSSPTTGDPNVTQPSGPTASTAAPTDGLWVLEPGDRKELFVGYEIEETLRGLDIRATGTTGAYEGSMSADGTTIRDLTITVDMTTIQSDESRRDDRMRTDGLETNDFPTATFTLTEPIVLPSAPSLGVPVTATLRGTLELHGTTNPVNVDVDAVWNGDTVDVAGEIPIVLADYGIDPPQFSFVSVRDNGTVVFRLRFGRS